MKNDCIRVNKKQSFRDKQSVRIEGLRNWKDFVESNLRLWKSEGAKLVYGMVFLSCFWFCEICGGHLIDWRTQTFSDTKARELCSSNKENLAQTWRTLEKHDSGLLRSALQRNTAWTSQSTISNCLVVLRYDTYFGGSMRFGLGTKIHNSICQSSDWIRSCLLAKS